MSEFAVNILNKKYILILCFVGGLFFLGYGIFAQINENNSYDKNLIVEATVDIVTKSFDPYSKDINRTHVAFKIDNVEYGGYLKGDENDFVENDKVTIYCNASNPNYFEIYDPSNHGYIFMGIGCTLIVFVLIIIMKFLIYKIKIKKQFDASKKE